LKAFFLHLADASAGLLNGCARTDSQPPTITGKRSRYDRMGSHAAVAQKTIDQPPW